ncbi:putative RNase H-like HicB family nuclease [Novosphingobium sp. SG751A]|uniref:type II toxin-antitoxin system HicB family antitoxin n=1 Tax=Novosphingobium sp. SG751A TaxID=2587000 RepID=UPI0015518E8D|nr:type II toxin-antitoxin system HicB family antitoxin [Novosphingobium sp. SG751A]NOW46200.1 putative RNase H-like HicB family nuclease [Novosphingobium sp. SG751A]
MKTYFAIVHKDEDSAFGVTFPDLPGCYSAADRIEDVLPNACEALELWFEDSQDIAPRDLAAISAEAALDLAQGAFIIAVPRLSASSKTVRVNLSLEAGMLADIDSAAAARRMTRSAFITEAARNEICGAH